MISVLRHWDEIVGRKSSAHLGQSAQVSKLAFIRATPRWTSFHSSLTSPPRQRLAPMVLLRCLFLVYYHAGAGEGTLSPSSHRFVAPRLRKLCLSVYGQVATREKGLGRHAAPWPSSNLSRSLVYQSHSIDDSFSHSRSASHRLRQRRVSERRACPYERCLCLL